MKTSLIPIGNSKGIIIPAPVIRKLGIQDKLELEIKDNTMLLRPLNPRAKWAEAFKAAENGDDELLIDSVFEDETFEEWEASSSMRSIG